MFNSYVIDAGRVKRKVYDLQKGTSKFEVGWISQSSGDQRAGRAGRTGPGHCYRLYSSAVFNDRFEKFEEPEVQRMPLEGVLLNMKTLGIDCVARFPWPSPPPAFGIHAAVRTLTNLGALVPKVRSIAAAGVTGVASTNEAADTALASIVSEVLTPLGRAMARLPLHPSLSRMLVLAAAAAPTPSAGSSSSSSSSASSSSLLDYCIAIAACLTIGQIFVMPADVAASSSAAGKKGGNAGASGGEDIDDDGQGNVKDEQDEAEQAPGDAEKALLAEIEQEQQEAAAKEEEEEARGDRVDIKTSEEARRKAKLKEAGEKEKAKRRELRAQAAAAHARFRHPLSDALTMLMAVGAFSHAVSTGGGDKAGMDFCRKNWLRYKAMREINQLRLQLHRAVHTELSAITSGGSNAAAPAEEDEGDALAGGSRAAIEAAGGGDEGEIGIDNAEEDEEAAEQRNKGNKGGKPRKSGSDNEDGIPSFKLNLSPFDATTGNLLRQLIASGLVERIAKRAPPMEAAALFEQAGITGKITRQLVPYIACSGGTLGPLFIHPFSACFDRSSSSGDDGASSSSFPEFVTYSEVVHTSRAYMRGVTAVDQAGLHVAGSGTPMLRYEAPLESPAPWYEANLLPALPSGAPAPRPAHYKWSDRAMCFRVPLFGDRSWKLTAAPVPFPSGDDDTLLRLFARGLLEGQVVPALKPFGSFYSLPPASITKRANQKRVVLLLEALKSPPVTPALRTKTGGGDVIVSSALSLARVWRYSTPLFLKTEVKAWLPLEFQTKVDALWPGIVDNFLSRVPKELLQGE